ncbi:MAG: class I SAM-dependent DNA methyltransferase [Gammaproteobacteria bacterium]
MNAVEIEEAVSDLARAPFDSNEFPFTFLAAFGNKHATIQRLRSGNTNKSDVGGVLQRSNIHLAVAKPGETEETLARLRESPMTERARAKFVLATDGEQVEAEDLTSGEVLVCAFTELGARFSFFLPLAGISTVQEIKNNPIDIKATGRLNKLYVELLKDNPDWGTAAKRQNLNRFMARLIFCFFAEDTQIFSSSDLFTATVRQMSEADGTNTHEVLEELFRAMNLDPRDGKRGMRPWADVFPYANGRLFADDIGCPRFSRTARAYLLRAGELDWKTINPNIFGSMIQAVADDDERGELGMHYTSVPNIQKVLDPLFLDDLREQLEAAGTNKRKLFNLRQRLSRIRVFDPACGSGNFLVIAYIRMREIEEELMRRRGEALTRSDIGLTQFYGIELKSFAAEIARLSLLIAEFQCDVRMIGQAEARALVLPLHATGNIVTGNALRLDWEKVWPPAKVSLEEHDLGGPTGRLALEDGDEDWETYICGNPPFKGARKQNKDEKADLAIIFDNDNDYKDCDYVIGWYIKSSMYSVKAASPFAFVSTNSIAQGEQVAHLWSRLYNRDLETFFAHTQFLWRNNATHNAAVHCVIVGVRRKSSGAKYLFEGREVRKVECISPYLIPGPEKFIEAANEPISSQLNKMVSGNMARDGGNLIVSVDEGHDLRSRNPKIEPFLKRLVGTKELNQGDYRFCLWIEDEDFDSAVEIEEIAERVDRVREMRLASSAKTTQAYAATAHKFAQRCHRDEPSLHHYEYRPAQGALVPRS